MITALSDLGISCPQLRLDGNRPDLSKLDDLFGQLSASTSSFEEELIEAEKRAKEVGIMKLFDKINIEGT